MQFFSLLALIFSCLLGTASHATSYFSNILKSETTNQYFLVYKEHPFSNEVHSIELSPEWLENKEAGLSNLKKFVPLAENHIVPISFTFDSSIPGGTPKINHVEIRPDLGSVKTEILKKVYRFTMDPSGEARVWLCPDVICAKTGNALEASQHLEKELFTKNTFVENGRSYFTGIEEVPGSDRSFAIFKDNPFMTEIKKIEIGDDWNELTNHSHLHTPKYFLTRLSDLAQTKVIAVDTVTEKSDGRTVLISIQVRTEIYATSPAVNKVILSSGGPIFRDVSGAALDDDLAFVALEKLLPTRCNLKL